MMKVTLFYFFFVAVVHVLVDSQDSSEETVLKQLTKYQEKFLNFTKFLQTIDADDIDVSTINEKFRIWQSTQFRGALESWGWVPEWLKRVQRWTQSTATVLNRRCSLSHRNMTFPQATVLFCGFLRALLVSGQMVQHEPEFLEPLENHTVPQGRDVFFTCVVNHLGSYKVAWIKSDTKAILAIHTHMVAQNPRLSVTHNGHNTWKLHISNVQKNDSGTYMCQINTDPMRNQLGTLEVVIAPDILDDNEASDPVAIEGGKVQLRCRATGVPVPEVEWKREGGRSLVFRHEGGREKPVASVKGETLTLTNVHRSDMGNYLCIAKNGVTPTRSKRFHVVVHFHPLIQVSNQLVAAPLYSNVTVQCYVEASPKAMNHWVRETGEKLIPSDKYSMDEHYLNAYSLRMNLTIHNLEKSDFGGYICKSSNALGKAEGTVRLQELFLPINSTSTASTPRNVDTKPRKNLNKDKPSKKLKQRTQIGPIHNIQEQELTTSALPEAKTQLPPQVLVPNASRPPWVVRSSGQSTRNQLAVFLLLYHVLLGLL